MRTRLTDRVAFTEELDSIATELEKIDPRLAMAVDQVSDALENRTGMAVGPGQIHPEGEKLYNLAKKFLEENSVSKFNLKDLEHEIDDRLVENYRDKSEVEFDVGYQGLERFHSAWCTFVRKDEEELFKNQNQRNIKLMKTELNKRLIPLWVSEVSNVINNKLVPKYKKKGWKDFDISIHFSEEGGKELFSLDDEWASSFSPYFKIKAKAEAGKVPEAKGKEEETHEWWK